MLTSQSGSPEVAPPTWMERRLYLLSHLYFLGGRRRLAPQKVGLCACRAECKPGIRRTPAHPLHAWVWRVAPHMHALWLPSYTDLSWRRGARTNGGGVNCAVQARALAATHSSSLVHHARQPPGICLKGSVEREHNRNNTAATAWELSPAQAGPANTRAPGQPGRQSMGWLRDSSPLRFPSHSACCAQHASSRGLDPGHVQEPDMDAALHAAARRQPTSTATATGARLPGASCPGG